MELNKKNRDIRENKNNIKEINENCDNCICNINQVILYLSNIMRNRSDILDKIENYKCHLFIDIGNEIFLTDNSQIDVIQGHIRRNLDESHGLKYIDSENVEDTLKQGIMSNNDYEIFSLPGYNLNMPCNHEGEDFLWMMSISKPNYTWTREDNFPITGVVRKNGNLELFDIDTKDSGNYFCYVTYIDPENEEIIRNIYKHNLQVVTLPRYALRGGNQYKLNICDDDEIEDITKYLPKKLNEILCKNDICETYIFPPQCHRKRIAINILVVPSNIAKLVPVGLNLCGIRCRKAFQDKITFLLSKNIRAILRRSIVFRLPHHRETLVPIDLSINKRRCKRCRSKKNNNFKNIANVGLLIGCPAGFNFKNTHCLPCLAGFYSEDGSSHCKKCPLGTHQPNTGARTCQACTNPFVEGCHEMILNLSTIIIILVIIFIIVIICSIVLCSFTRRSNKRKIKEYSRYPEIEIKENSDKKPLLKLKKKRTPNSNREININRLEIKKKNVKDHFDRKADKNGYVLVSRVDSYNSHQCDYENRSPKKLSRFKPPVPEPDFDR
ncbi:uncharacterized protein LOC127287800 [Leptopilina boulardi]|uniref:uncharacterized protein LOC127287800 n=1 Tax=Leptopilina boulardi TaxID=63433 RepID=UPI0021F5105A|nr:uncharacterized protein LOC127287800 [Leptopilina boulardi]